VNSKIDHYSKTLHSLICKISESTNKESSALLASDYVFKLTCKKHNDEAEQRMNHCFISCEGQTLIINGIRYFYKKQAIEELENGRNFEYWYLNSGKREDTGKITILPVKKRIVPAIYDINYTPHSQKKSILFIPKDSNFKGVDTWMHEIGCFQLAVGSKFKADAPNNKKSY